MSLATILHRTASGDLSSLWEYDPRRRVIIATVRMAGAAAVDFEVPVCSSDRMRHGAHVISRLDAQTWLLTPACCLDTEGKLVAKASRFASSLPIGFLTLGAAPEQVSTELAEL